jgi:hypothetical protein
MIMPTAFLCTIIDMNVREEKTSREKNSEITLHFITTSPLTAFLWDHLSLAKFI